MYCVTVIFQIHPGFFERFVSRVRRQAQDSVEREPCCHRFDVWQARDKPGRVFLYEVYADAVAFQAHLASGHFQDFDTEVAPWVADKTVTIWETKA